MLIVHEFVTDLTSDDKHRANARDLEAYLELLSDGASDSNDGASHTAGHPNLAGPFSIAGMPLWDDPVGLYIGKVRRVPGGDGPVQRPIRPTDPSSSSSCPFRA